LPASPAGRQAQPGLTSGEAQPGRGLEAQPGHGQEAQPELACGAESQRGAHTSRPSRGASMPAQPGIDVPAQLLYTPA
jgi:hypothetical protein